MGDSIIYIGGVVAAILTLIAFLNKMITPIRNMLDKYDTALRDANNKLEATEKFIQEHSAQAAQQSIMANKQRRELQNILRYIIFSETSIAKDKGYRDNSTTKDLEMIYQCYTEEGLNGLGTKQYHEYLNLPDYEEWSKSQHD